MEVTVLVVIVMIVRAVAIAVEKFTSRPAPMEPLCGRCSFAHVEFRASGRRDLFCGVGGGLRKVRGIVSFCTSFSERDAPRARRPAGFVQIENQRPALTGD